MNCTVRTIDRFGQLESITTEHPAVAWERARLYMLGHPEIQIFTVTGSDGEIIGQAYRRPDGDPVFVPGHEWL